MQFSIANPTTLEGIGLHTGNPARLTFRPAPAGTGVVFRRVDLEGAPELPARIENVTEVLRGTTLARDGVQVHTVEHVMAAIFGLGIDNLMVDLEGNEPPACDGSSEPFIRALQQAGRIEQQADSEVCRLREVFWIKDGDRMLAYVPSDKLEVTFTLAYPDNLIPAQTVHTVIDEETFAERVCRARTFGFVHEFDMLREKRLALGGSLDNAVVIKQDGSILNPEGNRDPQEFGLHKILDLVGDLGLIGHRLQGHIIAHKTGHAFNVKFARELCRRLRLSRERNPEPMMDIEEIKQILPHRHPFLLVDKILSIDPGKSAVGIKNVTTNEEFFNGHFPNRAIMPGVLIVEAMAQVAGVLFLSQPEHKGKLPFFCGIDKVRFRRPVVPGDRLELGVEVLRVRGTTGRVACTAKVDGELVTAGELMFSIV